MRPWSRVLLAVGAVAALPVLLLALVPRAVTGLAAAAGPGCLYDVRVSESGPGRLVALTIDDAPDPVTTPAILDALRLNGARATFFVISGQLGGARAVVERLRREGHEVGNHFTRDEASIRLDSAAFERDLAAAGAGLAPYGPVVWARPGSGWYSPRMVHAMRRAGYRCALGSVYPLDAAVGSVRVSTWYVLAHVRPGAVVILHDRGARGRRTAAVLGRVLPALRARGYRVVTLSELAAGAR